MMSGADDPAAEIEQRVKIDDARRRRAGDDPELVEDDRDRAGHEQLEKVLDPEMDDPESPQVDDGEVRRGVVKERGHVKDRDRDRGGDEQRGELARFVAAQPRCDRAVQEHDPQHQTGREHHLPRASEVEVFPSLVAEPAPQPPQPLMHSGEFAKQAPNDDQHERDEQHVYPQGLRARLLASDRWRQE